MHHTGKHKTTCLCKNFIQTWPKSPEGLLFSVFAALIVFFLSLNSYYLVLTKKSPLFPQFNGFGYWWSNCILSNQSLDSKTLRPSQGLKQASFIKVAPTVLFSRRQQAIDRQIVAASWHHKSRIRWGIYMKYIGSSFVLHSTAAATNGPIAFCPTNLSIQKI